MQIPANENQQNAENCISENLSDVLDKLTLDQIRFVIARQECSTDREAARKIGMSESTVYRWPDEVKRAVHLMAQDGIVTALKLRRKSLAKAMLIKIKGLDSRSEKTRQSVSTEIIEWELGKAAQSVNVGGNGQPIETIEYSAAEWREQREKRLKDAFGDS